MHLKILLINSAMILLKFPMKMMLFVYKLAGFATQTIQSISSDASPENANERTVFMTMIVQMTNFVATREVVRRFRTWDQVSLVNLIKQFSAGHRYNAISAQINAKQELQMDPRATRPETHIGRLVRKILPVHSGTTM